MSNDDYHLFNNSVTISDQRFMPAQAATEPIFSRGINGENQWTHIQALWDAVAECGASRTDEALTLLLEELASLVDAQHAYWMGTLRVSDAAEQDPAQGWRPRAITYLTASKACISAKKEHIRRINSGLIDPTVMANLQEAGKFRVNISHELAVDFSTRPMKWFHHQPLTAMESEAKADSPQ